MKRSSALAELQGEFALERAASHREHDIARLIPVAKELAERAGPDGLTVSDLRIVAVQRGILTGEESGRTLSYLPVVMRRAGLECSSEVRRSHIPRTHGNLQRVWRRP
jgi:hypothetical protein